MSFATSKKTLPQIPPTYQFLRNPGIADHDKDSILLAFADSSHTAWMIVLYLLRLTTNNEFFTQFLYAWVEPRWENNSKERIKFVRKSITNS